MSDDQVSAGPLVGPVITTVSDVQAFLDGIDRRDDEVAHSDEDHLHQSVLRAIASGRCVDPPAEVAAAALASLDLVFERWCA